VTNLDALFNLDNVFDVDDYLFVYQDDLTEERADSEIAVWTDLLHMEPPLKILDLACGFGRHSNRLAALGYDVTGVDYTPGFLAIARQVAGKLGVRVDYQQGDMRQIDFVDRFDRVLLLFTSFGYFTDAENLRVLENMVRALKPGGKLGLDIPNRDAVVKDLPADYVIEKLDGLVLNRLSFDPLTGYMYNRRVIIRDGQRKDKAHVVRLYNATEIQAMLKKAGAAEISLYGHDGRPLSLTSSGMWIVASKPG
jgi:SAM-dependent methyltransferase